MLILSGFLYNIFIIYKGHKMRIEEISNEEFVNLILDYSTKNEVEVIKDIEMVDGSMSVDVDVNFVEYYESKYSADFDETLSTMIRSIIEKYKEEENVKSDEDAN